ncbi:response regulator [Cupriavidus sp. EM10]
MEAKLSLRSLIAVVDDDESIRESLPDLLREFGFQARAFGSAEDFLASGCVDKTRCLVLDISMPGMTGPELQQALQDAGRAIPIVFITAHWDETLPRASSAKAPPIAFSSHSATPPCCAPSRLHFAATADHHAPSGVARDALSSQ